MSSWGLVWRQFARWDWPGLHCWPCCSVGNSYEPCGIWNETRWPLRGLLDVGLHWGWEAVGVTVFHAIMTPYFLNRKGCYYPVGSVSTWRTKNSNPNLPVGLQWSHYSWHYTLEGASGHRGPSFPIPPTEQWPLPRSPTAFSNGPGKEWILEFSPSLRCTIPGNLSFLSPHPDPQRSESGQRS